MGPHAEGVRFGVCRHALGLHGLGLLFTLACAILLVASAAPEPLREFFLNNVAIVVFVAVALWTPDMVLGFWG